MSGGPRLVVMAAAVAISLGFVLSGFGSVVLIPRAGPGAPGMLVALVSPFPTPIRHVFLLMFENTEFGDVMRNGSYERSLASHYAQAGQYYSLEHYSLPNYLAVTSGTVSNFFKVVPTVNLGDLLNARNLTWKGEEESMPVPCDSIDGTAYDLFHNPWVMYADIVNHPTRCANHVVNFTALNTSISTGHFPAYSFIVPNRTHDGHDTNVSVADTWLHGFLAPLINSTIFKNSVFFLTYDEGTSNLGPQNTSGGGHVYFAAVSPYAAMGHNSSTQYTDYNILTTTEWLLGLGHTGHNDNWTQYPPMKDLFSFPPTQKGVGGASGETLPAPVLASRWVL
jgi:phosphoesterase family protein